MVLGFNRRSGRVRRRGEKAGRDFDGHGSNTQHIEHNHPQGQPSSMWVVWCTELMVCVERPLRWALCSNRVVITGRGVEGTRMIGPLEARRVCLGV